MGLLYSSLYVATNCYCIPSVCFVTKITAVNVFTTQQVQFVRLFYGMGVDDHVLMRTAHGEFLSPVTFSLYDRATFCLMVTEKKLDQALHDLSS